MKWAYGILEIGDHIRVNRIRYYHHGIYIGKNRVIHFTGLTGDDIMNSKNVKVRETGLDEFSQGMPIEKAIYSHREQKNRFLPSEIVQNARNKIGEGGYNFINNNCEDLVNQCCYKKKVMTQIDSLRIKVARILKK